MKIGEPERERTRIKSPFTMTAMAEREVNGGAQVDRGAQGPIYKLRNFVAD